MAFLRLNLIRSPQRKKDTTCMSIVGQTFMAHSHGACFSWVELHFWIKLLEIEVARSEQYHWHPYNPFHTQKKSYLWMGHTLLFCRLKSWLTRRSSRAVHSLTTVPYPISLSSCSTTCCKPRNIDQELVGLCLVGDRLSARHILKQIECFNCLYLIFGEKSTVTQIYTLRERFSKD